MLCLFASGHGHDDRKFIPYSCNAHSLLQWLGWATRVSMASDVDNDLDDDPFHDSDSVSAYSALDVDSVHHSDAESEVAALQIAAPGAAAVQVAAAAAPAALAPLPPPADAAAPAASRFGKLATRTTEQKRTLAAHMREAKTRNKLHQVTTAQAIQLHQFAEKINRAGGLRAGCR